MQSPPEIGRDHSNRAYILTHDVSGVDWTHHKHLVPEHVYDTYIRYWKNVRFDVDQTKLSRSQRCRSSNLFFSGEYDSKG